MRSPPRQVIRTARELSIEVAASGSGFSGVRPGAPRNNAAIVNDN
jgi:hypothetical protein